ncbi:MAG: hypothetical protein AAF702_33305 [Chloroflexota bacterium]
MKGIKTVQPKARFAQWTRRRFLVGTSLFLSSLALMPDAAQARFLADAAAAPSRQTTGGIEFKVVYESGSYVVYMRPTVDPEGAGYIYTAQVTVKVPHGADSERVEVTNVQSQVSGLIWAQLSRVDAPTEDPSSDYISFELNPTLSQLDAVQWQAGQAVKMFSFNDANGAGDVIGLVADCDNFMAPNSAGTNPGNQIAVQGINIDNAYIGNYDVVNDRSVCNPDDDTDEGNIFLPLVTK